MAGFPAWCRFHIKAEADGLALIPSFRGEEACRLDMMFEGEDGDSVVMTQVLEALLERISRRIEWNCAPREQRRRAANCALRLELGLPACNIDYGM